MELKSVIYKNKIEEEKKNGKHNTNNMLEIFTTYIKYLNKTLLWYLNNFNYFVFFVCFKSNYLLCVLYTVLCDL